MESGKKNKVEKFIMLLQEAINNSETAVPCTMTALILMKEKNKMWNIIYKNNYKIYINNKLNLEIKVFDRQDYSDIYLNYKGYNILDCMGIWGFGMDLEEWDIKCKIHGDIKHPDEMYYSVDKKDERAFIDLIFFFINETHADGMISEEYKIQNW